MKAINGLLQPIVNKLTMGVAHQAPSSSTTKNAAPSSVNLNDTLQVSAKAISLYQASAAPASSTTYTVANALKQAASAADSSITISDTAANLAKNFDALVAVKSKLSAIKQTDAKAIAVTESQFSAGNTGAAEGTALLQKINNGSFSVAISGVHISNLSAINSYGSKVAALAISDTSANIANNLSSIEALGTKLSSITRTSTDALSVSYADTVTYAKQLALVDKGKYTLNLTDTSTAIKTNLAAITKLGTKVAAITQSDTDAAINFNVKDLKANLATLKKINAAAFSVAVEDTGASIASSWDALAAIKGNIKSLKLTDTTPSIALTSVKINSGSDLLNKISNDSYGLTLSDTAANITTNMSSLLDASSKITKISQIDKANITLSANQLTNTSVTELLSKFGSTSYGLAVVGVDKSNLVSALENTNVKSIAMQITDGSLTSSDSAITTALNDAKVISIAISNVSIANLAQVSADKRVKSIAISDSSANLTTTSNLTSIDALMKKAKGLVTEINSTSETREKITIDQATYSKYAATVFSAKKNFSLEVDLSALVPSSLTDEQKRNSFKTTANANGTFGIQAWDYSKGAYKKAITLNAGVNFLKVGAVSTFLDSGDSKLNAVLNVGTFKWQQSTTQSAANTSSYALIPNVYVLSDGSAAQTIKYKFIANENDAALLTSTDKKDFSAMSDKQMASVVLALNYISSLVNIKFELTTSGSADINFGTNNQGKVSGGYATGSNSAATANGVNLLLNNQSGVNADPKQGDYGWETLIHEVGHTLGLKHPGAYNAGGGTASAPYLSAKDDNRRTTVMSYNDATDVKNWTSVGNGSYTYSAINPSTYMPLDILALQFLYGKNSTGTSLTDDSISLSDFQKTTFTSDWLGIETLNSTGDGLDIDLSGVSASNIVDLRAGAFSSINIKESTYNANIGSSKSPQTFYNINNVGLAYDASVSNLIGGTGNDVVYVSNKDVSIDGGGGSDKVYLYGNSSNWTSSVVNETETDFHNGDVTVKLKNVKSIAYYDMSSASSLHSRVDLTA